jgi:hypothetical protein
MSDLTIRDYVDTNFTLRDRALQIQHEASQQALLLATTQLEGRLNLLNELRGNVVNKPEFDGLEKRVAAMENWQARLIGMGIVLVVLSGLIGAAIMKLFTR